MSETAADTPSGREEFDNQKRLERMYATKQRPVCRCQDPGIEMYIAKVGETYIVKRMPNTGPFHAPDCESYEPPPELSGLGDVLGNAIKEDSESGVTELRFEFSLSKIPGRAPIMQEGGDMGTIKSNNARLSLLSTLHYLWEDAGFNRWTPSMTDKRRWFVVRKHLLMAAETKHVKGAPLSDRLYIPESFDADNKSAIAQRRMALMAKLKNSPGGARQLMMLVGEVKSFGPARYGQKMIIKHAPDFNFLMNDEMHKAILKRYGTVIELWNSLEDVRLVAVATFSINAADLPVIEEIAFMPVTSNWIPFETISDKAVIDALTEAKRKFTKGLRYNLQTSKAMASIVISDTTPPTAMYIIPTDADDAYNEAVDTLMAESPLVPWRWDTIEYEIPAFPPAGPYPTGD